jgi:predicted ABC-type ATPase
MSNQPPIPDNPALVIIAGPNGSGKSSAYGNAKLDWEDRIIWINNPDLLTLRLQAAERLDKLTANLEAVNRIEKWLYASIEVHQTIGVETVLSTDKYRKLVTYAKQRGFEFWLIYVVLDSEERNIERVKIRAKSGGHDVPPDKIRERYWRSIQQFPWFLDSADRAWIYDNSGDEPSLIGRKQSGRISIEPNALAVVTQAVKTIRPA